ncbi:hypothetical protein A9D46_18285 [Photobacterium damselae subsp. damselae]|uniref:CS1-pili formation C-terminal domain-containing protein n=1 Tax=Photobacterium damselae TaxID=38293 RepID=UPI00084A46C4|nr:CS1-pili formation C-terminal domain-containing protein [Photobacterium damselae]OEC81383.1 hypothetical protein A9D46_18285 [Photobacterium damselae subsp. damselae]
MKKYYFSLKNSKRHSKKYFGFFIMTLIGSVNAQDIPEGFESFFKYQEAQIVVVLNENSIVLNANLKVDSVKLNEKEEHKLLNFLNENNVITSNTSKIIKSLTESTFYAKSCGSKEKSFYSCNIKDFGFYLDYTEHRLYIFLDESYYSQGVVSTNAQENIKYYTTDSDKISMINNLSYNGYLNNNSKNINVNDSLTTKFYMGQLHSDVDMNLSNEFDLSVNRLYYDYDFFDKFIRFGLYESNDNRYDNKTDLYKSDVAAKKIEFTFGNSLKLIDSSNSENDKAIQFYMPYDGWAELVRDNETISFKTLDSGNVKINYRELPKGKYNLKIIIHDQSNKKKQEKDFFISNFDSYGSNGLWGYKLAVGEFDKLNDVEDDKKITYINSIISKDFNEYINFGLENYISKDDYYLQFGFFANHSLGAFEFNYGISRKDSYSLESNISSNGLNVSYKKNKVIIDDFLSYKLFGDKSSELLSFNYSNNFDFLNYYLSYVISNNEMNDTKNRDGDSKNTEWTVGASYIGNGGVNYNLSYSKSIYDNSFSGIEKNSIISLLIDIPFNDLNYSSDFSYLDDRGIIADNTIKVNDLLSNQNVESSIYVKQRYSDERSTNSIGGNITYSNNRYMTNAYVDITDHGEYSLAINGINNISIKDENVNITSHKGDSILKINLNDNNKYKSYGKLILNNITDSYKKVYDLYNDNIISLVPYKKYTVYFDTELEDYIVKGDTKFDFYSLPGDVITHDVNLHKIKSFIVSFEDFNGNKIDSPKCKGNGCNGIEEVGDGVYSISLISGLDYKVISDDGICLFPDSINGGEKNFGTRKCFPHIDDNNGRMIVKSSLGNDDKNYEYIGMLSTSEITSDMKDDSSYKMVDADSYTYIFKLLDSDSINNIDIVINNKIKALIPRFTYNYRF